MLFFWMIVIVGSLLAYVVLDGYDLASACSRCSSGRPPTAAACSGGSGNVWDGNESWLILLAMGLWGGMPVRLRDPRCPACTCRSW